MAGHNTACPRCGREFIAAGGNGEQFDPYYTWLGIPPSDVIAGGGCAGGAVCTEKMTCMNLGGQQSGAGCPGLTGDSTTCCTLSGGVCNASAESQNS